MPTGPPPRQDMGGSGGTGNPTLALPPELIVLIARQCRHRNLTTLHLVSRRTHEVLDVTSLWCGAAVDRAGERAALAWAVGRRCGNTDVLRRLAGRPDCDLELGFRTAALRGHEAAAAVLLRRGAVVPADALEIAAARGHLGTLRILWESSSSARGRSEARALHAAAREGHVDVVEFLLDRGVFASLALQAACAAGHAAVVHAILERGPGLLPSYGLETAVSLGHAEVVREFLLERVWDGPGTPARLLEPQPGILALAVREEQFDVIRVLVAAWSRKLGTCGHMAACFHYAVVQDRVNVVRLFIELGIPVPPGSLDFAIKESATKMVRLLLNHVVAAHWAAVTGFQDGETGSEAPSHPLVGHFNFAVSVGNPEIVGLFLRVAGPGHLGTATGITRSAREIALLVAAERGHLEVVRMLCGSNGCGGYPGDASHLVRALARSKAECRGHLGIVKMFDLMDSGSSGNSEFKRYASEDVEEARAASAMSGKPA